jgi:glycosyltransferase involved in cell wall biosynthesis
MLPLSFGFLSTYPPTQCGLASFTAALRNQLAAGGVRSGVVRLVDQPEPISQREVVHHLIRGSRASVAAAADALNAFDIAVVQHEFGIYGGPDGDEVLELLDRLTVPVVVVLHTVLTTPTSHQREVLERVTDRADALVTMTKTAKTRLLETYDVGSTKVVVIPHGAVGSSAVDVSALPARPPTILTWGLLGPGKGIESVIDVLPALGDRGLRPLYRVVGQTHPKVLERDGEAYRAGLIARAEAAGVGAQVLFDARYLDVASLNRVVAMADVVALPYESREQVTSGVLIEAVAARKPVVATAFPHAVELLASGAGLVVPHGDAAALALALRRILTEPGLAESMLSQSKRTAPQLLWSSVAAHYRRLADRLVRARLTVAA